MDKDQSLCYWKQPRAGIIFPMAWKWRVTTFVISVLLFIFHHGIWTWLIQKFPENTLLEKVILPVAPPILIAFGIFFLDHNAKRRERLREERETKERELIRVEELKDQSLKNFIDQVSVTLLDRNVIYLSDVEERLGSNYKDPLVKSTRHVMRARTLSILRQFSGDNARRDSVIRFLIESGVVGQLGVSLSGSDLNGINLSDADLRCADLRGANLEKSKLIGAYLKGAKLNGAKLNEADLSAAWFNDSKIIQDYLNCGLMTHAPLMGANLSGADLRKAKLNSAYLLGADLSGALLTESNITNAYLYKADLSGSNLVNANLSTSKLNGACLKGANLSGANLSGTYLMESDLTNIIWDEKTKWPNLDLFDQVKNTPYLLRKQLGL
jgi:uncharacterized protein YjbI with pentapeptide repeats